MKSSTFIAILIACFIAGFLSKKLYVRIEPKQIEYITPEDFGANAHDTLDDTKAFQMAFDFSKKYKTRIIKLDSGTYILK